MIVGKISTEIEDTLGLTVPADRNIYFSQTNLEHMKKRHPSDYAKYGRELQNILAKPDYVGKNPKDGSIEYVKEFLSDGEYVKVAVRLSLSDRYYARSLYTLNKKRVVNFVNKGTLKSLT